MLWYMVLDSENTGNDRRLIFLDSNKEKIYDIANIIFACYTWILTILWFIFRYWRSRLSYLEIFKREHPTEDPDSYTNAAYITFMTWYHDKNIMNITFHAILAVLTIFLSPFFATLHLLAIININETAAYVYKAQIIHGDQLLVTMMLGIFFIYAFAFLNAHYYSGEWNDVDDIDVCDTLVSCFTYQVNWGFRMGGGIADMHGIQKWLGNEVQNVMKTVFDLAYFIIINVVSLNVIFGIIIDVFGEMRGEATERGKIIFIYLFNL